MVIVNIKVYIRIDFVCICVYIHVPVCHVYVICLEYINTCTYLFVVHLDIILLVVSDGDDRDSTKGWKSLFENQGVIEVHEVHEVFVHSESHSLVHQIIVTKRSVASGDNLIGATVHGLAKARCGRK